MSSSNFGWRSQSACVFAPKVRPPKSSLFDQYERSMLSSSTVHFRGVLRYGTVARAGAQGRHRSMDMTHSQCAYSSLLSTLVAVYEQNGSHSLGCSPLCCDGVYTTLYEDMKQCVCCVMKWWCRGNCALARLGQRQCECRSVAAGEEVHSCFRHSTEQLTWCECAPSASPSVVSKVL